MGLRKATDAEVIKHFMLEDRLEAVQAALGGLDRLRDSMGLVYDTAEEQYPYRKCGTCGSDDIKYHRGGYGDPGSYGCLVCGSSYDEGSPELGWRKPLLSLVVWELIEIAALHDPKARAFLHNHRKPAGGICWNCQAPVPESDIKNATCKACVIKYNRIEQEKRHA
jgi:Zn finger protein HypA/HybF involved in hydrogenase expression